MAVNAGLLLWARCELRRRWSVLALLALLVALGGGATIAAAAGARRTETAFPRMLSATRQANVGVSGSGDNGFIDLDPSLLDRVMKVPGVTGVREFAFVAIAPEGFANFFALAIIDRRGSPIHPVMLEGESLADFKSLGSDDVFLNEAMSKQLGKHVGDTVVIHSLTARAVRRITDPGLGDGPSRPDHPTRGSSGSARSPEDVSDSPDPFLLMTPAFYEQYHDAIGGCRCDVQVNAEPAAVDTVIAGLSEIYPEAQVGPTEDLAGRLTDTVALQRRTWWLIAAVAALAGIVALFQASARVGRLVATGDDARQALGMTGRERLGGRLLIVVPAIVVGTVAALGVAYLLSPLAPVGVTRLAEPTPGLRWEPSVMIAGGLLVLVVSLVVAGGATLTARRQHSGRSASTSAGGPQLAFGTRLAFGPGRGAILGVLLSTAGIVGALTLEHSLDHVLATPALYGADFDASNFLDSAVDKRSIGEQLVPDPDVEAVGLVWAQLETTIHLAGPHGETDVDPHAVESLKGVLSFRQTEGRGPARNDEVVLGRAVMEELGVTIGDRVTASGSKGTAMLTVVGDDLDPGVDVAGGGTAMTVEGLSMLGEASVQGAVLRFAPGADHAEVLDRYSALGFAPVTPPSEVGHIGELGGLPGRVGQLLALLGVAALVNTIVLTVRSGRREVALHRALGFTSWQVLRVHLWQSLITAAIGVVVGGSVGFILGRTIDRQLVGNVGAIAETVLPREVWIAAMTVVAACLGIGLVTGALALRRRPGLELRTE